MTKKTVLAEVQLNFVFDSPNLTKEQWIQLIIDVEQALNRLPSTLLERDFYTGFCGLRFHFREEINHIDRDRKEINEKDNS